MSFEITNSACLVGAHQGAVSGYISSQDCCEPTLLALSHRSGSVEDSGLLLVEFWCGSVESVPKFPRASDPRKNRQGDHGIHGPHSIFAIQTRPSSTVIAW